ncbi:hypothetical protein Tco_0660610 [Tanacetum coccineum]
MNILAAFDYRLIKESLVVVSDLIGDEDSTNKDGDIGVLVSLGDEIFSEGKKSRESNIGDSDNIRNGGKTAGRAIITWGGGISSLISKSKGTIEDHRSDNGRDRCPREKDLPGLPIKDKYSAFGYRDEWFVKETGCPSVSKVNNTEKSRKPTVKYAEMYRSAAKTKDKEERQRISRAEGLIQDLLQKIFMKAKRSRR